MKRSDLQRKTPPKRRTPLSSNSTLGRAGESKSKGRTVGSRRPISPASKAQREKVKGQLCVVCGAGQHSIRIDPAHLASRAQGGCDDPLCTVALCAIHHRELDDGRLALLPYLEPYYRREVAHAVEHLGILSALHRLTGERYVPEKAA